ncbi:MAG TPA: tetratricopeptide repeat protein [Bdellovibrionales bacterium]|nr:tetratricopeptide repeat protein [Bdellovibrionales bacterium]
MQAKPRFLVDEITLREIPEDPDHLRDYIGELERRLEGEADVAERARLLGEVGAWLRVAGRLELAEERVREALKLAPQVSLGIAFEVQQKIRLGHILQWRREFALSDGLFKEAIAVCEKDTGARSFLDFAYQHAGKNFFDQGRFPEAVDMFGRALELRKKRKAPRELITSSKRGLKAAKRKLS